MSDRFASTDVVTDGGFTLRVLPLPTLIEVTQLLVTLADDEQQPGVLDQRAPVSSAVSSSQALHS